jgi:hypothetical protein
MTHAEKLEYMKIAGGIVGFAFTDETLDMLVSTYELVMQKGGDTDLHDICKVKVEVQEREKERLIEIEKLKTTQK